MRLVFYSEDEIDKVWDDLSPEFDRVVKKAVHGEYTTEDLYRLAKEGRIHVAAAREPDGSLIMALAFEFLYYPSGATGCNVLAMAGRDMMHSMGKLFADFQHFCKLAGANWIECSVSPGMERMHRRFGFRTIYRNLRLEV